MATNEQSRGEAGAAMPERHPRFYEPMGLLMMVVLSVLGAIVGMQLITTLGITANTSIIGALVAMVVARIPITYFARFRSLPRQNLQQTAVSGATFAAGNSLLLPIGVPWALGETDLVWPMLIGATSGLLIDAYILYRIFDSRIMPASGTWPPGVAAAETIIAGDEGGKRAILLAGGAGVGIVGAALAVPMSAFGVAFIGNIWALSMFGAGLLINGYALSWFDVVLYDYYIPSGVMIGAGLVALIQVTQILRDRRVRARQPAAESVQVGAGASAGAGEPQVAEVAEGLDVTVDERRLGRGLATGFVLYIVAAAVLAAVTGVVTDMSVPLLLLWILYAAVAAIVSELIVGLSAMHSGWFPAFGTALAFLGIGLLIGFPPVALAVVTAFTASTGPAFADMGYDFKAGWMLRRRANSVAFELDGRRQQLFAELVAFGVALVVVAISWRSYFEDDLLPPVDLVYAQTIEAGADGGGTALLQLLGWAIPGAFIQWIGGPSRQMGILLATGLLITLPEAGWAVLAGLVIRIVLLRVKGKEAETPMTVTAAGVIAGDALYGFSSIVR